MTETRKSLVWKGDAVLDKMRKAQVAGVNKTMGACVVWSKTNHRWENQSGVLEGGIGSEFVLGVHGGELLEVGCGVVGLVLLEAGVAEVVEGVRMVLGVLGNFDQALNRLGMAVRLVVQKSQFDQRMGEMGALRVFLNELGQRGAGVLCIFLF